MAAHIRYIDLNPVRAGLAANPGQHYWNSYGAYVGDREIPWLTTEWVLSQFGDDVKTAPVSYRRFILEGMDEEDDEDVTRVRGGRILGDDVFIEEVLQRAEEQDASSVSMDDVLGAVCGVYNVREEALAAGRNERRMILCFWGCWCRKCFTEGRRDPYPQDTVH